MNNIEIKRDEIRSVGNDGEIEVLMTVSEVSKYLRIAKSTVYKLSQEGKLPGYKIGGAWRFSSRILKEWLEAGMLAAEGGTSNDGVQEF